MTIEECEVGEVVAIPDADGYLIGDIVGVSAQRVWVSVRSAAFQTPISGPRRIWSMFRSIISV